LKFAKVAKILFLEKKLKKDYLLNITNEFIAKKLNKIFSPMRDKINKRTEHKKKLKEVRISRLEKQLKSNILKRKKATKKNDG